MADAFKLMLKAGGIEAIQEGTEGRLRNFMASFVDPTIGTWDGTVNDVLAGALGGGMIGASLSQAV